MTYEIGNQKGASKLQMKNLIWKIDIQNLNGGYWECQYCGAIYNQTKNWNPPTDWCMKCRMEWR